ANKISMVIPVCIAVLLYKEPMGWLKATGVLLALPAVYYSAKSGRDDTITKWASWLPAVLFLGSGLLDASLKFIELHFLDAGDESLFTALVFASSFVVGLLFTLFTGRLQINAKNVLWGAVLGLPNYFSIFCLLMALKAMDSSQVFPLNNVGVVGFSAVLSAILFNERISARKLFGIILASGAILMLYYG
ncbi:MAG: EamA family transporter, partial [Flavobacteriales bacterium]